ncbi:hypothetical protein [Ancylobacter defluvii]|uniref:Uncharacterized protein n=1 Tax=Ancylobacter defluvii TaxID=1282440 RepID=A0A9W6N9T1_9HYPH|nr:hypothetical protein [Ancylobacter defluvii]MBS7590099.1 hypothetical protein [Ancylobacter defluvii]GLK82721.1 hypothetical protein GCM10017653_07900 [Ancylobacter defluvii]
MKALEQAARRICALDLAAAGADADEIPAMVDRYWPVVANEAREGVVVIGEWPFTVEEIAALTAEYEKLVPIHGENAQ